MFPFPYAGSGKGLTPPSHATGFGCSASLKTRRGERNDASILYILKPQMKF